MAKDFFEKKRPWSRYKDLILGYYLEPYLPKVDKLRKPILIVDCFAGPGQFEDGSSGSPIIICKAIKKWSDKGVRVSGMFIEADNALFLRLQSSLEQYGPLAKPRLGTFQSLLPELAALAKSNSVFLYIDPYSVDNLRFAEMRRVYEQIQNAAASVEVLMNFNVAIFMRWGLAALKRRAENTNFDFLIDFPKDDEGDFLVPEDLMDGPEITTLNAIAGGDYWQEIALDTADTFTGKIERFVTAYKKLMNNSFKWVGSCAIKSRIDDQVPKYYLVYATRSNHGIELMNESMCKAKSEFLKSELPLIFNPTTAFEEVDAQKLCHDVMSLANDRRVFTRGELRLEGMKRFFGVYAAKDYTRAIKLLLEGGRLFSKTGSRRINDDLPLSKTPFG
ncbi:MAG TPA: three-Cys-motif partner protein TcmP [Tepidisphaeraceae bacterium]|jgi:three-Cys-motif partner protein|nr:three-Cys-motif partner protein TcmP [Tepidisphaeraceae bacterium]